MEIAEAKVEGGGDDGADTKRGLEREKEEAVYLVWEKLTVLLVSNFKNVWGRKKRLLDEVTGFAEPGKIMAVMGPSGSGKSTFLDSLTGRLAGNAAMTGNILLNGRNRRLDYGVVAYVSQEDVLLGTLSVRETIDFSARLRLSSNLTNEERNSVVEATITELGLQDCADRLIGNWHLRGISGGEKKRLSIALEILTRPRLLFLDEPTSGLDSASAFFVIQTLRNISRDGRIVIASVHQPSSEVFALFDRLLLLSGGKTVYFGEAIGAVEFFAETGFPCPRQRNPSDHFLRCINSDFDAVAATLMGSRRKQLKIPNLYEEIPNSSSPLSHLSTEEIKAKLIDRYGSSKYAKSTRIRIQQLSTMEGLGGEVKCGSQAKWWKQLTALTRRSFVNMSRDVGYYWMRMVIYIILSISVGTIFFNVGTTYSSILARASCAAFVSGFMTFMSIGGFPSFIEEMKVFQKERKNGHYGVGVYTLSNFLSSFPFLAVMSITTATILFYMVKFRQEFSHYVYICLDFTSSIAVVESTMMIIASLVPNFLLGVIIGAGYIGIMMMTAGYFRPIPDLPKFFWRYPMSYLNYGAWALQGAFKNDMIGLEFDSFVAGGPKVKGEDILKSILGQQLHHSKWWDLAAVVSILITFRVLFFAILKLKERALPIFRALVAESFLAPPQTLARVYRKMQSFPSERHQPLQSLSSQEGLNSPHCTRSYNTLTMI